MQPKIESLTQFSSGRFFEVCAADDYASGLQKKISLFQSADQRWYREANMRLEPQFPTFGVIAPSSAADSERGKECLAAILDQDWNSAEGCACKFERVAFESPAPGIVRFSGAVRNTGAVWWFGWGVFDGPYDAVGVRFHAADSSRTGEIRILFPYECVGPGQLLEFDHVVSTADLQFAAEVIAISFDVVREGVAWFSEDYQAPQLSFPNQFLAKGDALEFESIPCRERMVSFTFDGGSHARDCERILDVLARHNVKSTMFLTGAFISRFPDLVRQMVSEGHEVGNHTLNHPRLSYQLDPLPAPGITQEVLASELAQAAKLFRDVSGSDIAPLWRAPFGGRNPHVLLWGTLAGYRHIFWSCDSRDWRIGIPPDPSYSSTAMGDWVEKYLSEKKHALFRGHVLLFHLGSSDPKDPSYPQIERLITFAHSNGYGIGTIGEMLAQR